MMRLFQKLTFRIGFIIVAIEIIMLSVVSMLYAHRFFTEIDENLYAKVALPGELINDGMMRQISIRDHDTMSTLVDENVVDAILLDHTGRILFSMRPEYTNTDTIDVIPDFNKDWVTGDYPESHTHFLEADGGYLINVSRIETSVTTTITYYLFIRMGITEALAEKASLLQMLFLGSAGTVVLTSLAIFLFFNSTVLSRIRQTVQVLHTAAEGDLSARITNRISKDEIGILQRGTNSMIARLQEMVNTLEERVQDRTKKLEEARQIAEDANRTKSLFLSNVSHELRTPLNTVIGYSSSMLSMPQMYENQELPGVFRRDVETIQANGQYLLGLINDILDLSKIEAGKLELNRSAIDLSEIFSGVIATSTGLLKDKPLQIRPDYPEDLPMIYGDAMRVRQILLNLMSNAIKFTETGSVTLKAQVERDSIHISVADTGIGIPEDALESIFDRFEQARKNVAQHYGGTGLGLDISQQLCQMHGSKLSIESTEGVGSTFGFTLPLATAAQISEALVDDSTHTGIRVFEQVETHPESMHSILLVEDHSETRNLLRRVLESHHFIVFDTHDGTQALELANGLLPDVIVLDVNLPTISGWEVLESLKADRETRSIPVLLMTVEHDSERAMQLGAVRHLQKPLTPQQLVAHLHDILEPFPI